MTKTYGPHSPHVNPRKLSPKKQEKYGKTQVKVAKDDRLAKKVNISNKERIDLAARGVRNTMEGKMRQRGYKIKDGSAEGHRLTGKNQ